MKLVPLLFLAVLLTGCSTSGARWYNPTTWFSGSEGRSVARVTAKLDSASATLLGDAQKTAHETQLALAVAGASRPVAVARESNDTTVASLDQLAGPLTLTDISKLRAQVSGLLSEVATERAAAEKERQARRAETAEASTAIDELSTKLAEANAALAEGFERENAIANSYRNVKFALYGTAALAALAFLGIGYLKFVYGGIPQAIGRGLTELRISNPDAGNAATAIFDSYLNRHEQKRIALSS